MILCYSLLVGGLFLSIVILCLRHTKLGGVDVSRRVVGITCGLAIVLPLAIDASQLGRVLPRSDYRSPTMSFAMTPNATNSPLTVGDRAPPIEASGWLNEDGTTLNGRFGQLVLVDLWANWCPVCQEFAPGLVKCYEKYSGRGVSFVSLSSDSQSAVQTFVKHFSIAWPSGYGATAQTIARFNAFNTVMPMKGYEVRPSLYLLDRDGRLLWSDDHARWRHQNAAETIGELECVIDNALAE